MENGEENCQHLIEAHKECMRKMGFNIWVVSIPNLLYKFFCTNLHVRYNNLFIFSSINTQTVFV